MTEEMSPKLSTEELKEVVRCWCEYDEHKGGEKIYRGDEWWYIDYCSVCGKKL